MKKFLMIGLSALALSSAQSASALDLSAMSAEEKAAFGDAVRGYLLENPEVIFEAVDVLKAQQVQEEASQDANLVNVNAKDIFDDGYSYVGGNLEGDITLVEFMDYRCGYCRKAHTDVMQLIESDGNIRYIVKELPILGDASVQSSKFAIAVKQLYGDEAYKSMYEALINFTGEPTSDALSQLSVTFGLDAANILDRMESDDVLAEIANTRALAQRLNINGTPTFVLQDELVRGYVPFEGLQQIVATKRD